MDKPVENKAKKPSNMRIYCVCGILWRIGSVIGSVKQKTAHPARGKMGWNAWFYWVSRPNWIRNRLTLLGRAHRRDLIVAGERVLTGGVFVLTFYEGCYLAAFTFPCFLRYRVTTFWLSNWYSCPVGSVDRCTPYAPWLVQYWFSLVQ